MAQTTAAALDRLQALLVNPDAKIRKATLERVVAEAEEI